MLTDRVSVTILPQAPFKSPPSANPEVLGARLRDVLSIFEIDLTNAKWPVHLGVLMHASVDVRLERLRTLGSLCAVHAFTILCVDRVTKN